jgi:hypothetical protein
MSAPFTVVPRSGCGAWASPATLRGGFIAIDIDGSLTFPSYTADRAALPFPVGPRDTSGLKEAPA